ncbi:DUF5319 domain-containing protein [Fodinicola acaciae]|uniref:DUF5319 domain-containing protein n=1 Tax=Fodinicola acaciae TaxID=2681555 RepID=UPI0013D13C35|nr:DUF5319 domain-containing protein [Fodinicola acaciae]
MHEEPIDPFAGDPADPARAIDDPEPEQALPLSPAERQDVLDDLSDLEVYEALLAPRGYRGVVVDCQDCQIPHYFGWHLLRANLRHLLEVGESRVHEPAYNPDPAHYVTFDYARGYADGVQDSLGSGHHDD